MTHHREEYARGRLIDAAEQFDSSREASDSASECDSIDDAELVYHGLAQLSRVDREVLTLFFLQDLSIDEVAEVPRDSARAP